MEKEKVEVVIIGGSYAGLSAAMALGRSLRHVLVIDAGKPCNRFTPHAHNFITHDGAAPHQIASKAKADVLEYPTVSFLEDLVVDAKQANGQFEIVTQSGKTIQTKKMIFATGVRDLLPDIRGFADCWGISVIHCPYCHGYEFKGQKTGLMASGEAAFHKASLIHNLSDELTILTHGGEGFSAEQQEKLSAYHIEVIETPLIEIEHLDGQIQQAVLKDGSKIRLDALYASLPFEQQTDLPVTLGCKFTENGYVEVDEFQKTSLEGVYACGDNTTRMRSLANAISQGNTAGAMVNMELVQETF